MTHAISDDGGVICAFALAPVVSRVDRVGKEGLHGQPHWLHLNLGNAKARRWLEARTDIPQPARELLLESNPRIQGMALPGGVVAVLGDVGHDLSANQEQHVLRVYLDAELMITARTYPLKSVDLLRRELQAGDLDVKTPIALFEHLVECVAGSFGTVVTELGDQVDDAEDRILAGEIPFPGKTLGAVRRTLARLRRQVNANRAALTRLPGRLPPPRTAEQERGLRQAVEGLDAVGQDLELVQERARLLQEEIAGRLTEGTNRNLFLLSMVTTTLLPITLITGMFGMNVGGLPWLEHPSGFWLVILVMVVAVVVTLILLRRRRVL